LREDAKAKNYTVKAPLGKWNALDDKADADQAWTNPSSGATLALRSLCFRYEHIPLKSLNQNVLSIVNNAQITSQEETRIDSRSALDTVFVGDLDGVQVETRHVVLKKDHCIFDFTLSQIDAITPQHQKEFSKFVNSFHFEGGSENE